MNLQNFVVSFIKTFNYRIINKSNQMFDLNAYNNNFCGNISKFIFQSTNTFHCKQSVLFEKNI